MKDKDRLWIMATVNVEPIDQYDVPEFLNKLARSLWESFDTSVRWLFVPTRTEPSNFTVIYDPKGYRNGRNKENLRKAKEILKKFGDNYGVIKGATEDTDTSDEGQD